MKLNLLGCACRKRSPTFTNYGGPREEEMSEKKLGVRFIRDKNNGSVSLLISGLSPQEVEPFYQRAKELIDSGLMDVDITVIFRFKRYLTETTPPK